MDSTSSIHGTKWEDTNGNGVQDANEPGLAGVTIYLDLNNNGTFDADEPSAVTMADDPSTNADESGRYWLTDVIPGEYIVREVVPDGFVQTFPPRISHRLVVQQNEIIEGVDFGNMREPLDPPACVQRRAAPDRQKRH